MVFVLLIAYLLCYSDTEYLMPLHCNFHIGRNFICIVSNMSMNGLKGNEKYSMNEIFFSEWLAIVVLTHISIIRIF